jgi:hypothetical protein
VIPLRMWLQSADRPGRQMAGDWSDEDVARLRDGLKRGQSLAELAASLARGPEEVAARICQFRPLRIMSGPDRRLRQKAVAFPAKKPPSLR